MGHSLANKARYLDDKQPVGSMDNRMLKASWSSTPRQKQNFCRRRKLTFSPSQIVGTAAPNHLVYGTQISEALQAL